MYCDRPQKNRLNARCLGGEPILGRGKKERRGVYYTQEKVQQESRFGGLSIFLVFVTDEQRGRTNKRTET